MMGSVQLPGCTGFFVQFLSMFSSSLVERFCPWQRENYQSRVSRAVRESTGGRRVQAWASLGALTVLAGESGTIPLWFFCVPKNAFENSSIIFFLKEVP